MINGYARRACAALAAMVALAACGTGTGPSGGEVANLRIEPQSVQVSVNGTAQLEARLTNAAGEPIASVDRILWTSENDAIAQISGTGVVTGRLAGTTRIAASYRGLSGIANVTVGSGPVASVVISPSPLQVDVGSSAQLEAVARDAGGTTVTGRPVTWASQDLSIASVTSAGLVSGVKPGQTTVTATVDGVAGAVIVTVSERPVATVQVTPSEPSLRVGETQRMTATARAAGGEVVTGQATWSSSDSGVAEVSADGLVKANAPGKATITATVGGVGGSTVVTVTNVPVARVEISPRSADIVVDSTVQFSATTYDDEGDVLTGRPVVWETRRPGIATVSATGAVRGTGSGTVTITATSEGRSDSVSVTVRPIPIDTIVVTPEAGTVFVGDTIQLPAGDTIQLTAVPYGPSGQILTLRNINWSTDDPAVATVTPAGLTIGVAAGATTISASADGVTTTVRVRVLPAPTVPAMSASAAARTMEVVRAHEGGARDGPRDYAPAHRSAKSRPEHPERMGLSDEAARR